MIYFLVGFIGLHVFFRMLYFFYIGGVLRRQSRRHITEPLDEEWNIFKERAEFVLNADTLTFLLVIFITFLIGESPYQFDPELVLLVPNWMVQGVGVLFLIVGGIIKTNAYLTIGDKGWYWYNFFCPPEHGDYELKGVYQFLENPMYGLGYLPLFGVALVFLSTPGLLLAIFDWIVVWLFYFLYERPYTQRIIEKKSET